MKKINWLSPWTVMVVTGLMYVFKWLAKISVGHWVNSPALIADGFHNLADLIEVGLVMFFGVHLGRQPKSENYPMGRKRMESILVLIIGAALLLLAFATVTKSVSGLCSLFPALDRTVRPYLPTFLFPTIHNSLVTGNAFIVVALTTGVSAVLSMLISRYEIFAGKKVGVMSMVADGEETKSDGRLEISTFIGFVCKFGLVLVLGNKYPHTIPVVASGIEYTLGVVVAFMVFGTAKEMISGSFGVLLARSIGKEKVNCIRELINSVEGVQDVNEVVTFSDGTTATCIASVVTRASSKSHGPMRRTLEKRIAGYLAGFADEYIGQEITTVFIRPDFNFKREAEALIVDENKDEMIAPCLVQATHIRTYDTDSHGKKQRAVNIPVHGMSLTDILRKLEDKNVQRICVFLGDDEEKKLLEKVGIAYSINYLLRSYVPHKVRVVL